MAKVKHKHDWMDSGWKRACTSCLLSYVHGDYLCYKTAVCRCLLCKEGNYAVNKSYNETHKIEIASRKKIWHTENRQVNLDKMKARRVNNRESYLGLAYGRAYGVTPEIMEDIFKSQNSACAICLTPFTAYFDRKTHRDHDHSTGVFRGFLCSGCNNFLGRLEKVSFNIQPFLDYLRDPPAKKI